jgi:hypothetical protein
VAGSGGEPPPAGGIDIRILRPEGGVKLVFLRGGGGAEQKKGRKFRPDPYPAPIRPKRKTTPSTSGAEPAQSHPIRRMGEVGSGGEPPPAGGINLENLRPEGGPEA